MWKYIFRCTCGASKELRYETPNPPAPYDVPRTVVCGVGGCEKMMQRGNR